MNHANLLVRTLLPLFSAIIVTMILTARRRPLFIRRIQGLSAVEEAVGRATEMGRPMVCTTGLGINGGIEIVTLQALAIVSHVVRLAARYTTQAINPVYDPQMLPIVEEAVREAYVAEGRPDRFNADDVRFLSNRQFAFAASTAGIIFRERAAACFFFGYYYAESLIFAEASQQVGAISIAGTTSTLQIPFFIAACDYVIIGDEFYAASAYLTREPTSLGSIVGQDYVKMFLLLLVLTGSIVVSISPPMSAVLKTWFTK
jgi:hypothetical protein